VRRPCREGGAQGVDPIRGVPGPGRRRFGWRDDPREEVGFGGLAAVCQGLGSAATRGRGRSSRTRGNAPTLLGFLSFTMTRSAAAGGKAVYAGPLLAEGVASAVGQVLAARQPRGPPASVVTRMVPAAGNQHSDRLWVFRTAPAFVGSNFNRLPVLAGQSFLYRRRNRGRS
jgi:hypothetical protein